MNTLDPTTKQPDPNTIASTLFDSEPPQSPIPEKRERSMVVLDDISEAQVKVVVAILSSLLETSPESDTHGLMTIYLVFIDVLLQDLMGYRVMKTYMALFHDGMVTDVDDRQVEQLRSLFLAHGIVFRSLRYIDSIFSHFYTSFLEINAKKQRKEHGQFYTPQSIVQFMWDSCLADTQLLTGVPRVFDPCMGIGSFLCEFLTRLVNTCMVTPGIWNNAEYLMHMLCHAIPQNIWGVEIDPFAFKLGKLNVLVHLFPLYKRITELSNHHIVSVDRLHLFCNDTLKLTIYDDASPWEQAEVQRLRDATQLKFDYIVTNPPYMIRKTGLITEPDPALYDARVLGGRSAQAYLYFMWICMQRCDPVSGQLCLITPSQWMILEFARHLRAWMWQRCQLLQVYQFEPYKVWPKIQTDSLIFRLRMRHESATKKKLLFLRHMSRKAKLDDILYAYTHFDSTAVHDPLLKYKLTCVDNIDRIRQSPNASFAFLSPTSKLSDQLSHLTSDLPRLCNSEDAPLEFHRGPNTNPVYALVVRTQWARETFGRACCDRWLRPAFYWSGKSKGVDKESTFWLHRDPQRLTRKETSPAEAYLPLIRTENGEPFYSMILVDKTGAHELERDPQQYPELYRYLSEAREALQDGRSDRKITWCHYNKCGADVPVKIVHPINYGYFTKSQPRQRFFMDRSKLCLTNQCMYFTPRNILGPTPEYFCGLLNSSTVQFFIKEHCYYDQQGRTRFFGKNMANIPCALPSLQDGPIMTTLVQIVSNARFFIYAIVELTQLQTLMEKVRGGSWDLSMTDVQALEQYERLNPLWREPLHWDDVKYKSLLEAVTRVLQRASLCQYAIDHLVYALYQIPQELQRALESELNLMLTETWQNQLREYNLPQVQCDRVSWGQCIIKMISSM